MKQKVSLETVLFESDTIEDAEDLLALGLDADDQVMMALSRAIANGIEDTLAKANELKMPGDRPVQIMCGMITILSGLINQIAHARFNDSVETKERCATVFGSLLLSYVTKVHHTKNGDITGEKISVIVTDRAAARLPNPKVVDLTNDMTPLLKTAHSQSRKKMN